MAVYSEYYEKFPRKYYLKTGLLAIKLEWISSKRNKEISVHVWLILHTKGHFLHSTHLLFGIFKSHCAR